MLEAIEIQLLLSVFVKKDQTFFQKFGIDFFEFPKSKKLYNAVLKTIGASKEELKNALRLEGMRSYEVDNIFLHQPATDVHKQLQLLKEARLKVRTLNTMRQLVEKGSEITLAELREHLANMSSFVEENAATAEKISPVKERLDYFAKIFASDILQGFTLGLPRLDALLGELLFGRYIVIGARPSVGKTALMLQIAYQLASQGKKCAVFTLEQPDWQLLIRLYSHVNGVEFSKAKQLLTSDFEKEIQTVPCLENLYFEDTPARTPEMLIERLRALVEGEGVRVWFVDYLQLIGQTGHPNVEQFTSHCSRLFKNFAKSTKTVGFVLSQLNRQSEGRADNEARLADLRYSGSLEQDADIVILLSRKRDDETVRTLEVAKNRDGRTGKLIVDYDPTSFRFDLGQKHHANGIQELKTQEADPVIQKFEKIIETVGLALASKA